MVSVEVDIEDLVAVLLEALAVNVFVLIASTLNRINRVFRAILLFVPTVGLI